MKKKPRHQWTAAEKDILRTHYPTTTSKGMEAFLPGIRFRQIESQVRQLGLHKSSEAISCVMREAALRPGHGGCVTRFKKGLVPHNKGMRFVAGGDSALYQFKPGHDPHNQAEIGTIRRCSGYLQRKVTDTGNTLVDFVPVHRLMWLEAGRELPDGSCLIFRDGNRDNLVLENFELVTRRELMTRNSVRRFGTQIANLIQLRGAINRRINNLERKNQHEDH